MGLNNSEIKTFEDLGESFVRQYHFNMDMAPDRDQLRSLSQKERETFKEYAQRWRGLAAQIIPPLEEKEMTKIFLKPLGPFFYEKMVASAPTDFTEMVSMGMRLEEGVREGQLTRENALAGGPRKIARSFSKNKESQVNFVSKSYSKARQQHVAAVMPATNTTTYHQPQFQQQSQQFQPQQYHQQPPSQQHQQTSRPPLRQQEPFAQQQRFQKFDHIPMRYSDLLPSLL